jgi:hypothetical protein
VPKSSFALFAAALVGAAVIGSPGLAAPAGGAAGAKAFVERLYSHYPSSEAHPYSPFGAQETLVFDAAMVALIRRDAKLAHGEVGALDADPICQCQDDSGMKSTVRSVALNGPAAATALVDLRFADAAIPVKLSLVLTKAGWRIHDISSKDTPSLRAYLTKHAGGR